MSSNSILWNFFSWTNDGPITHSKLVGPLLPMFHSLVSKYVVGCITYTLFIFYKQAPVKISLI